MTTTLPRALSSSGELGRIVLALTLAIIIGLAPVSPASGHVQDLGGSRDTDGVGGPVTGSVRAYYVYEMGLCRTDCVYFGDIGKDPQGARLGKPAYYSITVGKKGGSWRVTDADVASGTYRIAVTVSIASDTDKSGYVVRRADGSYGVTERFADGTGFTVRDAQALDVGTLSLIPFSPSTSVVSSPTLNLIGYGGRMREVSNKLTFKNIPRGARIVIQSYGCGRVMTRTSFSKAGTFSYEWKDPYAYRHYENTLSLRVAVVRGSKSQTYVSRSWNVSKHRWRCS